MNLIGFYQVFLGFTGFYRVFWGVLLGIAELLPSYIRFYWVLLIFTELYWVLLGFPVFLLSFNPIISGFTGF